MIGQETHSGPYEPESQWSYEGHVREMHMVLNVQVPFQTNITIAYIYVLNLPITMNPNPAC